MLFLANFVEWEPMEAITRTSKAYHVELGRLIFKRFLSAQLQAQKIFFYEDMYVAPKTVNGIGKLVPKPTPTIAYVAWPILDNASVVMACLQIASMLQNAMKCA